MGEQMINLMEMEEELIEEIISVNVEIVFVNKYHCCNKDEKTSLKILQRDFYIDNEIYV